MRRMHALGALACLGLTIGLGGCAYLPKMTHWVRFTPLKSQPVNRYAREDGYYASAVAAIGKRQYGDALDLLQAANAQRPDDVRVLNAFGVVYDKLGRFDVSDRYYQQARALDPKSSIVAHNIAYSALMQAKAAPAREPVVQLASLEVSAPQAAASAPPPFDPTPARPAVIRLGFAAPTAAQTSNPRLAGRALDIVDASGRADGAEPVRQQLVRLGWSAPAPAEPAPRRLAKTTVSYPARSLGVAQALARTLPAGVQLVDCGQSCEGVHLTLGADSLGWGLRAGGGRKGE